MRPTRAYVAARYARREEMRLITPLLEAVGMDVRASWIDGKHESDAAALAEDPGLLGRFALEDLREILLAEVFLTFSEHPDVGHTTGGRHIELGYALGCGLRCIVIGPQENVFHHIKHVEWYEGLDAFLTAERARIEVAA